jgi:biotin carboxyl carrier protein
MKMENSMTSNYEGTVKQILVEVGQAVAAGTILAEVE